MAEWGYISFRELKDLNIPPGFEVECEQFWQIRKASQVDKIRMGNHWQEKEASNAERRINRMVNGSQQAANKGKTNSH